MIGSVSLSPVNPVAPAREVQAATAAGSAEVPSPSWATISRSGELLSKFQQLAESDPAKLQASLGRVSEDLRASAKAASGPQADTLNDLADRFAHAATAGNVSALSLATSHHRHHATEGASAPLTATAATSASAASPLANASSADPAAQATMDAVLAQVDRALGMNPPPFGPWFTL
jgi:hypothetical protein